MISFRRICHSSSNIPQSKYDLVTADNIGVSFRRPLLVRRHCPCGDRVYAATGSPNRRRSRRLGDFDQEAMRILGIETSCDETAVAVVENGNKVLAEFVYSQVEHTEFGGIVPEIASRQQLRKIVPLFEACKAAYPLSRETIDGIAVTYGPGLIGSLLVGLNFAKGAGLWLAIAVDRNQSSRRTYPRQSAFRQFGSSAVYLPDRLRRAYAAGQS